MAPNMSKFLGSRRLPCEECWVTLAHDETSAVRALVLAKCLRRVVTTRRIAVVVCDGVPEGYRKTLHCHFDQCLTMEWPHGKNGLALRLRAIAHCWSLPFMKKCVFLDYDSMVVQNCDELFDYPGTAAVCKNGLVNTATVVLEPAFEDYCELYNWIQLEKSHKGNGTNMDARFSQWIMNRKGFRKLPKRYNLEVNPNAATASWSDSKVCITHFTGSHPMDTVANSKIRAEDLPLLQKALVKYWQEAYMQDVASLLQNPAQAAPPCQKTNPQAFPGIQQNILDANKEPIAIVGMSCRFPQSDNVSEYLDNLMNGRDCITQVPDHRWPTATSSEFREVNAGFLKCPVDTFDGKFFNISPYELENTDPQQRFLLEVTWEALENAGIDPHGLKGSNTGVFVGTWTQDYRDLIKDVNGDFSDFHRTYMGNSLGGTSGRLSFLLGLTGPNIASESGCSSGMVAVHLACKSLRERRSDIALAAGANLLLFPFQKKHMVNVASPDGRCKTFDSKADGFGRAEGVATLVLKRYSDAVKAGDNILALIRGSGVSQEGTSRSFGTPTKDGQMIAMKEALLDAGVDASEVSYVEAHGTGTVIGDTTEMASISNLYCKERQAQLFVASGKTNIGHTESCSGLAAIIKVILQMKHNIIFPHINLENLNPHIDINNSPIRIPTKTEKWQVSPEQPVRIAGISSFGITGTNTHLILQEPPNYNLPNLEFEIKDRPLNLTTFSAKSEQGLKDVVANFSNFLQQNTDIPLGDIAYTLNTGRAHFPHRIGVVAGSTQELLQKLKNVSTEKAKQLEGPAEVCFLYTGQGSQYYGMAKELYESSPCFRINFDKSDKLLQEKYKISIKNILWDSDDSQIHQTLYSQISIFIVEYCLTELWKSWGIKPHAVMGHSLGEFAAAVAAGILDFEDALHLVCTRSKLIQEKCPLGSMVAIKAGKSVVDSKITEFLQEHPDLWLDYAAFNSSEQTVLAGSPEAVKLFSEMCRMGTPTLKTHILDATSAFHSRDMDYMLKEYEDVAKGIVFRKPRNCVFISGVEGKVVEEMDCRYWGKHTRDPVRFQEAASVASANGYKVYLEVGPQPILSALKMTNDSDANSIYVPSLRKSENSWKTLLGSLSRLYEMGLEINWRAFDRFYSRRKCNLPTYPFFRKKHWYDTTCKRSVFNGKTVHPLLGSHIPNATSNSLYQTSLNLEKLSYLKDHSIGGSVIFPASAYLEMSLSSGCLATTGTTQEIVNPMSVQNLVVEKPLGLIPGEMINLQSIVTPGDENGDTKISIHSQKSEDQKWVQHATSSFEPLQVNYRLHEEMPKLENIQERCVEAHDTSSFYEALVKIGLEFGDSFKSLQKLWRNSTNDREILAEIKVPEETAYVCHPIALDALIQTIMICLDGSKDSLHVPLVIGRVTVYSKSSAGGHLYAHCSWEEGQPPETRKATLYDSTGKVLVVMESVQMVQTTTEAILKNLSSHSVQMPNLYEEQWRSRMGPCKHRVDLKQMNGDNLFGREWADHLSFCNDLTDELREMVANRRKLVYLYVLRGFYELGWRPGKDEILQEDEFLSNLKILPSHKRLIHRYFQILEEEGTLRHSEKTWTLAEMPPSLLEIEEEIKERVKFIRNHPRETGDSKVFIGCGEKLSTFLSGKDSALSFLFPEDKTTDICAETFYNESITVNAANAALTFTMKKIMENHVQSAEGQRGVIRFLEVGAGTGSCTKRVLPIMDKFKAKYNYTFTDISPAFFLKSRESFQEYGSKLQYKVLNIEEDPLSQGFIPGHYDIIMASNVLHATRDLAESVRNCKSLLRPGGILLMVETLQPIREYDVVFGLLDGFWRFDDHEIRPAYPNVSGETWNLVCSQEGYERTKCFPCFDGQVGVVIASTSQKSQQMIPKILNVEGNGHWLIFADSIVYPNHIRHKFQEQRRSCIEVRRSTEFKFSRDEWTFEVRSQEKADISKIFEAIQESKLKIEGILYMWGLEEKEDPIKTCLGFLFLAQILLSEFKGLPKVLMVTEGMMPVAESQVHIEASPLWGMIRSFRTEHFSLHVRSVDLDPDDDSVDKYSELFTELWNDDQEYQVAYRERSRHVCRLVQCKDFPVPLTLPNSERFSLALPKSKNIADLRFVPNGRPTLERNEVDVEVRATGLNFRDVFVVLKPDEQFESMNCLGLEFSGVVTKLGPSCQNLKVGDRVMGCKFSDGALPSHIQMEETMLFKLLDDMTFSEASTLPACFGTAYYCLVMVAKLKKDETILIHAASGGVGLVAIQVARSVGAKIIATAGKPRKRQLLRNLGIEHVFNSRATQYSDEIMNVTGGQGVDVVLNSLTSEGFKEATLKCLGKGGRFVEMSKLHIWSPQEVKLLRPDVDYSIVDLTTLGTATWLKFWEEIAVFLKDKSIQPIPYTRFEAEHIREALLHLQKARHIGKIIVTMPQMRFKGSRYEPETVQFNPISTYLITGGLGGIGIEITKWMVKNGAQNIVLTSRRAPNEKALEVINALKEEGNNIVVMQLDVGDFAQCERLFKSMEDPKYNLPKLRGIFHAAGTLSDATYPNQSIETFKKVFQGKVYGALNLHTLSQPYNLEFFTMFSSMVSILGPIGLCNYAGANAYLDALCHHRHSIGLCAQSINWGQWAEVGAAKDISMPAVRPFKPSEGLVALEQIMRAQKTQVAVLDVDFSFVRKLTSNVGTYLEELKIIKGGGGGSFNAKIGNFWKDFGNTEGDRLGIIKNYIVTILKQILKFDEDETIDENVEFQSLGIDSLMMVEMKNFLQTMLGKNITLNVSEMAELTTVNKLSAHIFELIAKTEESKTEVKPSPT